MTWLLAVAVLGVSVLTIAVTAWQARSARRCPSCGVELVTVSRPGEGPNVAYEVVACPHCSQTGTIVHGARATVAVCPVCHEHALELPTVRLAGLPPRVGVRETCSACGHERSYTVIAGDHGPGGTVIPFPGAQGRPPRRPDRQSGGGR
jgi:hypothetical protein